MVKATPRSPSEDTVALEWAEIAGIIEVRPDGSWQMTDFAKEWLSNHPATSQASDQLRHSRKAPGIGPISHGIDSPRDGVL